MRGYLPGRTIMRDRRIRGAFVALILVLPALIVLATSVTMRSILEMLAVDVVVVSGLFFATWAKAHAQRPQVVNPVRIPVAPVPRRPERSIRTVA
jgi:hypothetical protein